MDDSLVRPADVPIWILVVAAVVAVNIVVASVLLGRYVREQHECR